jgi:membrane protein DedA with SNARE-associated domain
VLASLSDTLTQWIQSGGLVAVFLLMTLESCGVPFPSEVTMPFAGFFAAQGHLSLGGAIAAGTLGNLVGSLIAFGIAAWLGKPVLLGPGRYIGIRRHHVEIAERWFQRHGLSTVFWSRLLPVVRTYISFPAGLARMRIIPFSGLTLMGSLPWSAGLALLGWAVGRSWNHISGPITDVGYALAVVLVLVVVGWFVRGRRHQRREPAAAEALAASGPDGERG